MTTTSAGNVSPKLDLKKILDEGMQELMMTLLPRPKTSEEDFEDSEDENYTDEEDAVIEFKKGVRRKSLISKYKVESKEEKEMPDMNDVYIDTSMQREARKPKGQFSMEEIMKKSVITPGFERLESLPPINLTQGQKKKLNKAKRESSRGENWFNMPAPEMTTELKNDLEVLRMRSVMDPKHFYKKNDLKTLPKYFHVGRIVEGPADFYNSRIPKKQRKQTMVDELLADAEFQQYNKKRYKEIIEERRKTSYKAHRRANRLKRKGKSRK